MSTIGTQLKQTQNQLTRERIARQSDMLRKFVKEDLLHALQAAIANGDDDFAPVIAPKEIRSLFAAALDYDVPSPYTNKRSVFHDVWRELDEWAAGEDLFIRTGHSMGRDNRVRPWDDYDWGGSLGIRKKIPAKPTPPEPQRIIQGASISRKELGWGLLLIALVLFTYFIIRH